MITDSLVTQQPAPATRPPRRKKSRRATGAAALSSFAAITFLSAAWLRWGADPRDPTVIGLQGISPLLLPPATFIGAIALWRRPRLAAAIAVAGIATTALAIAPDWGAAHRGPAPAGSVDLSVASANVYLDNPNARPIAAELVATDADVILVQEVTPALLEDLEATIQPATYPYRVLDPRSGGYGSAIFSKLPLRPGPVNQLAGWPVTSAEVVTANGPVDVLNVHLVAPLSRTGQRIWRQQLAELGWTLEPARRVHAGENPMIAMGDYNATRWHRPLATILDRGLRDAFTVAGRGLGLTWPHGSWTRPMPLMRLDHAVVDPRLGIGSAKVGDGAGSDHHPIFIKVSVPATAG